MVQDLNAALITDFKRLFIKLAMPSKTPQMKAYMRNQFEFYGVMTSDRHLIIRQLVPNFLWRDQADFLQFIEWCWKEQNREFKYVALDLSRRFLRKLEQSCIPFYEQLIARESWWDTVDGISPQIIGGLLKEDKMKVRQQAFKWIEDENIWYKRSALILQLFYKEATDFNVLGECVLRTKDSKEFFIQKAAGWALRQYSKTNPEKVKLFLAKNKIPPLSYREGMKYIVQKGL